MVNGYRLPRSPLLRRKYSQNQLLLRTQEAKGIGKNLVVPEKGPTIQGWADRETMLADMDSGGVDKAVLLGWYWETPETCALHNRWHAEWIRKDPERFIAFAAINPLAEKAIDELKVARDEGFRGIGEILPAVQGFSMRDSELA